MYTVSITVRTLDDFVSFTKRFKRATGAMALYNTVRCDATVVSCMVLSSGNIIVCDKAPDAMIARR